MDCQVSVLTVSCLVQADPQLFDVETSPVLSPAEARLSKVEGLKLAGGALAAGAGLAFIKNYWNKPATNTYYKPATTSNTYYKPGYTQYYHQNNQYPTYYQYPSYPSYYQQDQQFSHYKPSSVYYVKPYSAQPPPPRHTSHYQMEEEGEAQTEDTEELEQRIMEDEGLYSIGIIELPQQSRVIKKLLAGGAGLAAGYYLTNKYNQYKNNNKYPTRYYSSSSKPSYHYPAFTNHHQSGYKPSYPQNYRPAYPAYPQYQPSYRPPAYNHYQAARPTARPTYYTARDLQARSDSTCFPELVLSLGGNHLYKCRGL